MLMKHSPTLSIKWDIKLKTWSFNLQPTKERRKGEEEEEELLIIASSRLISAKSSSLQKREKKCIQNFECCKNVQSLIILPFRVKYLFRSLFTFPTIKDTQNIKDSLEIRGKNELTFIL